jgi:hypothetical protein
MAFAATLPNLCLFLMSTHTSPQQSLSTIERIIASVLERGIDDQELRFDDYQDLLPKYEFRNLVILELYNAYFPPKRHEFDLQIVTEIVNAILSNRQAVFIGTAALSGIIGSVSYDMLRGLLKAIIAAFGEKHGNQEPFREIQTSAEKVVMFFEHKNQGTIEEIANFTGIDPERVLPLLRLLGYRCKRQKKKKSIWLKQT